MHRGDPGLVFCHTARGSCPHEEILPWPALVCDNEAMRADGMAGVEL